MRGAWILLVAVLLLGCSNIDKGSKEEKASKFATVPTDKQASLEDILNISGETLAITPEEINLSIGEEGKLFFAVKNPSNSSECCIYLQFRCRTALKGDSCDPATGEKNTGYYWPWFRTGKGLKIPPDSRGYFYARVVPKGAPNVYLGEMEVWLQNATAGSCKDVQHFSEREGIKQYAKADFMLRVE